MHLWCVWHGVRVCGTVVRQCERESVCGVRSIGPGHKHQTESKIRSQASLAVSAQHWWISGAPRGHPICFHWPLGNLFCLSRAAVQPCSLRACGLAGNLQRSLPASLLIGAANGDATSRFGAVVPER